MGVSDLVLGGDTFWAFVYALIQFLLTFLTGTAV